MRRQDIQDSALAKLLHLDAQLAGEVDAASPSIVPEVIVTYLPEIMRTPRMAKHEGNGANGSRA